jgi:DNA polymerase-3 subunit beta
MEIAFPDKRKQAIFILPTIIIVSQLIEGTFPDFSPIVPKGHKTRTVMSTAALQKACRTADIFARESSHTARVRVEPGDELSGSCAKVTATGAETGDQEAIVDADVTGDAVEIAFNVKFLTDVLGIIDTPQVALETTTAMEPGVIKPVGNEDFFHIIMPMHFGR